MSTAIKLIYIAAASHSGSTLLDLLISSHSKVVSVGEVHQFERNTNQPCTCGAQAPLSCPFWSEVNAQLVESTGKSINEIGMCANKDGLFARHQLALFSAVRQVSGVDVIVDSSKNPERLDLLLGTPGIEVYPIHLIRQPQGVVYSHVKKGRHWWWRAMEYARHMARCKTVLRDRDHLEVHYEDLATRTSETLQKVMEGVGLEFEPSQLEWAGRKRHNYRGNRMRNNTQSIIQMDVDWHDGVSRFQARAIDLIAAMAPLLSRLKPGRTRRPL